MYFFFSPKSGKKIQNSLKSSEWVVCKLFPGNKKIRYLLLSFLCSTRPSADQRYRIFFFPGIVYTPLTHSIWDNFVFFFLHFLEKKNTNCFLFFPRKSLQATHSKKNRYLQKKVQKKVLYAVFRNFSNFFEFWRCIFFFSKKKPPKNVFFFSQEKFKIHSLTQILRAGKKKYSTGKKNTTFSLTHSIFDQKWQKLNFSREIKKYGTFV